MQSPLGIGSEFEVYRSCCQPILSRVYIILVAQVASYCMSGYGIFMRRLKASENAPKCSMHTNECSEMSLPPQCRLFSHKLPSNLPFSA